MAQPGILLKVNVLTLGILISCGTRDSVFETGASGRGRDQLDATIVNDNVQRLDAVVTPYVGPSGQDVTEAASDNGAIADSAADADAAGDAESTLDAPPSYVVIETAPFFMGAAGHDSLSFFDELPRTTVELTTILLVSQYEVTQEQWEAVAGSNPSYFYACGPNCPVERVNWYDVLEFLNRMSARDGLPSCYELSECEGEWGSGCVEEEGGCDGFRCDEVSFKGIGCPGWRLPTEAEAEMILRAGSEGRWPGALGDSARRLPEFGQVDGSAEVGYRPAAPCGTAWNAPEECGTVPVGSYPASPYGLHDALGNVWEMTTDYFAAGFYTTETRRNPTNQQWNTQIALRGCSFPDGAQQCRIMSRGRVRAEYRVYNIGFRPVRTLSIGNLRGCSGGRGTSLECLEFVGGDSLEEAVAVCENSGGSPSRALSPDDHEYLAVRRPSTVVPLIVARRDGRTVRTLDGEELSFRWWQTAPREQDPDCVAFTVEDDTWSVVDCNAAAMIACERPAN